MRDKLTYRLCGFLYILTCSTFLVRNSLIGGLIDTENIFNTFKLVLDNASLYRLAIFIDFMGVVALMALVITLFHILKPINQYLALLALGWRIGEVVILAVSKIDDFLILTLSQQVALSPGSGIAELNYLGQILISRSAQGVLLAMVFFSIGSIFYNILFYKSKAIPFFLAILGLIGAALATISAILSIIIDLPPDIALGAWAPIILFEFILGFYLIIWGMKKEIS
jgi:hypothetical protein